MCSRTLLPVVLLTAMTGGCGVWTTHQNVSVTAADRTLRFGEPDNGLRLGIDVKQDTDREDDGLVLEECRFVVHFEAVPPRDAAGKEVFTYLLEENTGGSVTTPAMKVTLTTSDGQTFVLPQTDEGVWIWAGTLLDHFDLDDVAPGFRSPTTATLQVAYHVDPVPDHPERWSGTIHTPPIRVKFYRMKSWSLFG
jgi:hypothetical protein